MARESLRDLGPARLSWGAILGGSFFALGLMVLLSWLGVAIGLTTVDAALRGASIWMVIWSFLVPLIALFLGGLVAGRFGGATNRRGGAVLGAVTWGFTTAVTALVGAMLFMTLMRGVVAVGGAAATAAGGAVSGVAGADVGQAAQALGVDAQDLLGPVNEDRTAQGLPPLQAESLQAALQDAVNTALQEGRLNREVLVTSLVENTQVSRPEAERLATRIEGQVQQAGAGVTRAANQALDAIAGSAWYLFASSLLSLLAAIAGGAIGVSRTQRQALFEPTGHPPYVPTGGEAYP